MGCRGTGGPATTAATLGSAPSAAVRGSATTNAAPACNATCAAGKASGTALGADAPAAGRAPLGPTPPSSTSTSRLASPLPVVEGPMASTTGEVQEAPWRGAEVAASTNDQNTKGGRDGV